MLVAAFVLAVLNLVFKDGCSSFRRPVDTRGDEAGMSDRNVPVTKGAANDRELTRLMAGLPGMVYRSSAQFPFAFDIVGEGYERILGRSLDELTVRQVAVAMLKKLGYEAEAVPDGASCRMLSLQTKKTASSRASSQNYTAWKGLQRLSPHSAPLE